MLWNYCWCCRECRRPGGSVLWGCLPKVATPLVYRCAQRQLCCPDVERGAFCVSFVLPCRALSADKVASRDLKCEIQELKWSKFSPPSRANSDVQKEPNQRLCPRLVGSLQYNLSWWQNSSHYLPLSLWTINPGKLSIGETREIRDLVQMVKLKVTCGQVKLDEHGSTMSHGGKMLRI